MKVHRQDEAFLTAPPGRSGEGDEWVSGWCWLWCGHQRTQVRWIGTVSTWGGAQAPLYACGPCLARLGDAVWDYTEASTHLPTDDQGRDIPLYSAVTPHSVRYRHGGRHRKPRTTLGRLFQHALAPAQPTPARPAST